MTHELYKTKEEIESWLNKYQIENYDLIEDSQYGYVVNVNKKVEFWNKGLKEIKVKFNKINGSMWLTDNQLKTLKGCPREINGSLMCQSNQLENLDYIPEIITGKCYFLDNPLLEGFQYIDNLEEIKKIRDSSILNKKLEQEIKIDKSIKHIKI